MKIFLNVFGVCKLWLLVVNIANSEELENNCSNLLEDNRKDTDGITNKFVKKVIYAGAHMTLPELMRSKGFPVEIHSIISEDGYYTTLYRIPHGRFQNGSSSPKKVVYLHHGFLVDAGSWILNSVDKALAYRLADLGDVDVWMGNSRGTGPSIRHVNLDAKKHHQYWNFSFHEIGVYDLPRIIDYVLDVTKQPDMYYIGHSMGCNELLVALSTFPEYNSKIRTFIGLAPGVFVGNASSPLQKLAPDIIRKAQELHDAFLSSSIGIPYLLPLLALAGDFCAPRIIFHKICYKLLESFFGFDTQETNYDMSAEVASHGFSTTSTKTLFHLFQMTSTGEYKEYDYGRGNYDMYGMHRPPHYNISKVTVPTALYCGANDNLVPCVDVSRLSRSLSNLKEFKQIIHRAFNHVDFLFAKNINPLLNDRIIEIVKKDLFYVK